MNIWNHPYTLYPGPDPSRAAYGPRQGALLKVVFDQGITGYADLHPWEEFGHSPLEDHLASLGTNHPTALANLALRHARTDAAARRAGVSLFYGLPHVDSHALFTDWTKAPQKTFAECATQGASTAKLKIGRCPEREAIALNRLAGLPLQWRLDANALFTPESLASWLAQLSPQVRQQIEFIEDPCLYDPATWAELSKEEGVPFALDWQIPITPPPWPGAEIIVIKPATQDAFPLALAAAQAGMDMVVTHSMDHPLGRSVARWTAMRLRQRHGKLVRRGGLQAAGLYRDEPGDRALSSHGFGFDELLEQVAWQDAKRMVVPRAIG